MFICRDLGQRMCQRGDSSRSRTGQTSGDGTATTKAERSVQFSMQTVGLWSTFEALCLHESVLQRAEAFSLADQEVETIVDALVEGICSRLGVGSAPHASKVWCLVSHLISRPFSRS